MHPRDIIYGVKEDDIRQKRLERFKELKSRKIYPVKNGSAPKILKLINKLEGEDNFIFKYSPGTRGDNIIKPPKKKTKFITAMKDGSIHYNPENSDEDELGTSDKESAYIRKIRGRIISILGSFNYISPNNIYIPLWYMINFTRKYTLEQFHLAFQMESHFFKQEDVNMIIDNLFKLLAQENIQIDKEVISIPVNKIIGYNYKKSSRANQSYEGEFSDLQPRKKACKNNTMHDFSIFQNPSQSSNINNNNMPNVGGFYSQSMSFAQNFIYYPKPNFFGYLPQFPPAYNIQFLPLPNMRLANNSLFAVERFPNIEKPLNNNPYYDNNDPYSVAKNNCLHGFFKK